MMTSSSPVQFADWDDLVFAGRAKAYGAYDLRKRYPRHLMIGLAGATLIGLLLLIAPWLSQMGGSAVPRETIERIVDLETLAPPPVAEQTQAAIPPPPPPELPQLRQLVYLIPDPTPIEEVDPTANATMHSIDSLQAAPNLGIQDLAGDDVSVVWTDIGQGEGDIPDVIRESSVPDPTEFRSVEAEPVPINLEDLRQLIGYPSLALDADIEGTVVLRVLVGKDGSYQRHLVVQGAHPLLTRAVEAQIYRLSFTPAIQGGNPVYFWVNIPFVFRTLD